MRRHTPLSARRMNARLRFMPLMLAATAYYSLASYTLAGAQIADLTSQPVLQNIEDTEWGTENGFGQFVLFLSGGDIAGSAGCNSFFGSYAQGENTLKLGALVTTQKSCPDIMGAEKAFLAALENTAQFKASPKNMNLLDSYGDVIMSLRRQE